MSRRYYITEVFADGIYSGNQLATVVDCDGLSSEEMQQIARAFNFAETTFFLGGSEASGFDVRIFTPESELPFAGHPTLGSAYLIKHHLELIQHEDLTLNLGVGPIKVWFESDGVIWMRQNAPVFGAEVATEIGAASVGLNVADLQPDFPCQTVSTGLEILIVPVRDLKTLRSIPGVQTKDYPGVLAFCGEGYLPEHQYASRVFAPGVGVPEDAATGSATGCLAAYLAEHAYHGESKAQGVVGQGYEIGRPSALHLSSKKSSEFIVEVGGKVNLVAEGHWHL
jgi:trans-2,3-dihydro-3-hydroxyanthranilate isomerase